MAYNITKNKDIIYIKVNGEFDALLAKELQSDLEKYSGKDISEINFDLDDTEYIASTGLRVMIFSKEYLGKEIKVNVRNANESVREVMEMSGIDNFINLVPQVVNKGAIPGSIFDGHSLFKS